MWFSKLSLVGTRRYLDVGSRLFERYGRQMNVKTTLYDYWVKVNLFACSNIQITISLSGSSARLEQEY